MNYLSFFFIVCAFIISSITDTKGQSPISKLCDVNAEVCFMDTLIIGDPILIKFYEFQGSESKTHTVLVSKSYLDSISTEPPLNYKEFLCSKNGYLFWKAGEFTGLLYSEPFDDSEFYTKLRRQLSRAERHRVTVPYNRSEPLKKYRGWPYYDIYPRKFLLFLVKGSIIRQYEPIEYLIIKGMDNVYFKVLVPITWE